MTHKNTTNAMLLEALANDYSLSYGDRIDEYTQDVIADIATNWMNNPTNYAAFNEALVGLITEQTIHADGFENPLAELELDEFSFGETEQEIYVNFAKGYRYNPFASVSDAFAVYRAYILNIYHHVNWRRQYAVSVDRVDIRRALFNNYGLQTLIEAKIQSLRGGYNWDSYISAKELVVSAYDAGMIYPVTVPEVADEATALALLVEIQDYATLLLEPNPQFNIVGSTASTPNTRDLVLIVKSRVNALLKVYAKAHAYNIEQLDNRARQIVVSTFNSNTSLQAILVDARWFHIRNQYEEITIQHNAAAIYDNHFLTGIKMMSYSGIFPIIAFTTDQVETATMTIADGTAQTGTRYEIQVTVTGSVTEGQISLNTYDLYIEGQKSAQTVLVPGTPIIMIGDDEKASEITVTGFLRSDQEQQSPVTATITISQSTRSKQISRR